MDRVKKDGARNRDDNLLLAEYEEALRIDRNDLDSALIQQPEIFFRVADELALAISRRDAAKHEFELKEAGVDGIIRQEARDESRKTTNDEVKAEVMLHKDVQARYQNYIHLTHVAARWEALKNAFNQRSYVLKDLVALHLRAYSEKEYADGRSASHQRYDDNRRALQDARDQRRGR